MWFNGASKTSPTQVSDGSTKRLVRVCTFPFKPRVGLGVSHGPSVNQQCEMICDGASSGGVGGIGSKGDYDAYVTPFVLSSSHPERNKSVVAWISSASG